MPRIIIYKCDCISAIAFINLSRNDGCHDLTCGRRLDPTYLFSPSACTDYVARLEKLGFYYHGHQGGMYRWKLRPPRKPRKWAEREAFPHDKPAEKKSAPINIPTATVPGVKAEEVQDW